MTMLTNAEAALANYKRDLDEGHPWLPGHVFINNPGLGQHVLKAMEEFVRVQRVAEQAKPARRVSLTGDKGEGDVLPGEEVLRS